MFMNKHIQIANSLVHASRPLFIGVCLLCASVSSLAQFYLQKGTTLSLGDATTIVSSQETWNQINADIIGEGTLLLNAKTPQILSSTQEKLVLPNLQLENADWVAIHTELKIENTLKITKGILLLTQELVLKNQDALVLGETAGILSTNTGQLVYSNKLLEQIRPPILQVHQFLKYTCSQGIYEDASNALTITQTSHRGSIATYIGQVHCKYMTPPPEAVG